WRDWRGIARTMPIAVVARPGYDGVAVASPAMAWLRRFSMPLSSFVNGGEWSAPALVTLRFDPDERSATAIRRADPDWASRFAGPPPRDQLTHRLIPSGGETTAP
ncbi:MAG: nicotinic acid mononucleotide adenylyltransferase, partial [Pseudomonadota bacterium]|nr:nicotinic acid mononucleotide adenylyltransferase [Pseudomonadota bacterium]